MLETDNIVERYIMDGLKKQRPFHQVTTKTNIGLKKVDTGFFDFMLFQITKHHSKIYSVKNKQ